MTRWSPLSEWPREGELICIHDGRLIALAIRRGPWLEVQSPEMRVRLAECPDWTWTEAPEPPKHSSNPESSAK